MGLMDVISCFWEKTFYMLILYFVCLSFNYISEVLVVLKNKQWKSYNVSAGAWRIIGSMCAVAVGGILDLLIEFMNIHLDSINIHIGNIPVFCCLALGWCILSELRGISKNARNLGYAVPRFLEVSILRLKEEIEDASDAVQESDTKSLKDNKDPYQGK